MPRWVGRAIGLDVHREFCVVAICEDVETRSAGRVPSTPPGRRVNVVPASVKWGLAPIWSRADVAIA
jgi:hypothetical protein